MKNLFVLLTSFILISLHTNVVGQISFSHAVGGTYLQGGFAGTPAGTYSPRVNFLELGDEFTLSAGTHISLGYSGNSRTGPSSLVFDLPLMLETNIGNSSTPDANSDFGGFFGIGYGISKLLSSDELLGTDTNNASGMVINGGVRVNIQDYPLALRISYLLNKMKEGDNVFGVGLFIVL